MVKVEGEGRGPWVLCACTWGLGLAGMREGSWRGLGQHCCGTGCWRTRLGQQGLRGGVCGGQYNTVQLQAASRHE
jgi:hypothetical protein